MVAVLGPLRDRRIQPGDLEVRVRRRRTVALHVDEPRRRRPVCHAQRLLQGGTELPRPLVHHLRLVLLPLVVEVVVLGQLRLLGELEEGVVKHLVVDVQLAHLRMGPVAALPLQRLVRLLLQDGLTDLRNPCGLDEVGKLERGLLDAPLSRHVLALAAPMPRNSHGVSVGLQIDKQAWVGGGRIPDLDNIRPLHQGLQLCNRHPRREAPLLLGGHDLLPLLFVAILSLLEQRRLRPGALLRLLVLLPVTLLVVLRFRLYVLEALSQSCELRVVLHPCPLENFRHNVVHLDVVVDGLLLRDGCRGGRGIAFALALQGLELALAALALHRHLRHLLLRLCRLDHLLLLPTLLLLVCPPSPRLGLGVPLLLLWLLGAGGGGRGCFRSRGGCGCGYDRRSRCLWRRGRCCGRLGRGCLRLGRRCRLRRDIGLGRNLGLLLGRLRLHGRGLLLLGIVLLRCCGSRGRGRRLRGLLRLLYLLRLLGLLGLLGLLAFLRLRCLLRARLQDPIHQVGLVASNRQAFLFA
mmetsp:Transcript_94714/g.273888  ORF Transcript_94714/g.273888 Transcript_94714/m.273888 type:complete len:521 (-) Transcript_94714:144-1706(-)